MSQSGPTFLIASPSLDCPVFGHSVVLLVDHDEEGSFGFVISKPSALSLPEILKQLKLEPGSRCEGIDVVRGGPVSEETGWVIFDPRGIEGLPGDTMHLREDLAVTASFEMLEKIARDEGPERGLLSLGYAGWGPSQLEDELREGSWLPVDVDLATLFEVPFANRWDHALGLLGIEPWRVVPRGSAQA